MATKKTYQNMAKELEGRQEGQKAKILIDSLRITLKNMQLENAKPWWHTWILMQEIHLDPWQISTQNEQMPTRSRRTQIDD